MWKIPWPLKESHKQLSSWHLKMCSEVIYSRMFCPPYFPWFCIYVDFLCLIITYRPSLVYNLQRRLWRNVDILMDLFLIHQTVANEALRQILVLWIQWIRSRQWGLYCIVFYYITVFHVCHSCTLLNAPLHQHISKGTTMEISLIVLSFFDVSTHCLHCAAVFNEMVA